MSESSETTDNISHKNERTPFLRWSVFEIASDHASYLREENPNLSEDDANAIARSDHDTIDYEWEHLVGRLSDKMDLYNPDGLEWRVTVEGFGWRNSNGGKTFAASNGVELLRAVLPNTDCTFNIYTFDDEKRFAIRNWHHDSPMGNEWYYIEVMKSDA